MCKRNGREVMWFGNETIVSCNKDSSKTLPRVLGQSYVCSAVASKVTYIDVVRSARRGSAQDWDLKVFGGTSPGRVALKIHKFDRMTVSKNVIRKNIWQSTRRHFRHNRSDRLTRSVNQVERRGFRGDQLPSGRRCLIQSVNPPALRRGHKNAWASRAIYRNDTDSVRIDIGSEWKPKRLRGN